MTMRSAVINGTGLVALFLSPSVFAETPELDISGLVEVEASSSEEYDKTSSTDATLAKVELAVDTAFNERVSAHVSFLYEEDNTDFGLDEGTISLALGEGMAFTAGRMYVPFGRYDSFMISDPQTLVMGETVETALMVSAERAGVYGFAYVFNGDSDEAGEVSAGDNTGISGGVNLGYAQGERFDVGVSYISNIGDTDTLQELQSTPAGINLGVIDRPVAGASAYFTLSFGKLKLLGEHVAALDSFSNGDLDGSVQNKERPSASNLEIGVEVGGGMTLAAAYQKSAEAHFIGLPKKGVSVAARYEVSEGAALSAEYAVMEDYATGAGGTGERARRLTMQLAVEF